MEFKIVSWILILEIHFILITSKNCNCPSELKNSKGVLCGHEIIKATKQNATDCDPCDMWKCVAPNAIAKPNSRSGKRCGKDNPCLALAPKCNGLCGAKSNVPVKRQCYSKHRHGAKRPDIGFTCQKSSSLGTNKHENSTDSRSKFKGERISNTTSNSKTQSSKFTS